MFRLVKKILSTKGRISFKNKVYNMIIDNGYCTNIVSTTLVIKLNLIITKHAKSYKLQSFNEYGELR